MSILTLLFTVASLVGTGPGVGAVDLAASVEKGKRWIIAVRQKLHQYPELGFKEVETSQTLRLHMDQMHIPYKYPIAKTGFSATIGKGKPVVALRADIDALPIQEPRGRVWFNSRNDGRMHACGHDSHMAMLLGAARALKDNEEDLKGTVKLIFQPGEEGFAGAKQMVEEGVLDDVDAIFAVHNWPALPAGIIASRSGTLMAGTAEFRIVMHGRGGHAAMPHQNIDPVPAVAALVSTIQTIVSRETSPLSSLVISVTQLEGGDAHNVTPDWAALGGTLRALTSDEYERGKKRVAEAAEAVGAAHRCNVTVDWDRRSGYPPTMNHEIAWDFAKDVAKRVFGENNVTDIEPTMGGEDFAFYTQKIPGAMIFLGHGDPATNYPLHSPKFVLDDSVLPRGARLMAELAYNFLENGGFQTPANLAEESLQTTESLSTAESDQGHKEL